MKRYIQIALIALVAQCGLSDVVYGMQVAPTTVGPNSIVDAIKKNSNLTDADVNQYKLLWLGGLGTAGAFLAGAASTVGAGVKAYQYSGAVQAIAQERVPSWMTNALLAGLGSTGAGYISYRMLYPRIRAGIIAKVQKFLDVCDALHQDSPADQKGTIFSIVSFDFYKAQYALSVLQAYLPRLWPKRDDLAVYSALDNLAKQGERAQTLLNQIGTDPEVNEMREVVNTYSANLSGNVKLYGSIISDENKQNLKKQLGEAKLAGIQAGTSLMKAKTLKTYGTMLWNGLNFLYEHKQMITGALASAGVISAYSYMKAKLGY